jgi:hypothetical protein
MKARAHFLAGIAVLFLATGTAHARAEHYPPPDHSKCTTCKNAKDHRDFAHYLMKNKQQDPRFRPAGADARWQNPDFASLAREARKACGR